MKKFVLLLFVIVAKLVSAQTFELVGKDTINLTDAAGKRQGKWIVTNKIANKPCYTPEQKVEEGVYVDGRKTGLWKEYYCNNNLKSEITFENNRPSGYAKMYHENGKIKEEGLWKNNRWVGDYKLYYENGQVQQAFKFNTTGKREGDQKYFYENGQKMIEGNWAEGKEAGIVREYYENGDLKSEKNFEGGFLDVASVKNFEPKQPVKEVVKQTVKDPDPTPPVTVEKVEKPNSGTFNGEGQHTLYNANKQISKKGLFHSNRLVDGKVYIYSSNGILTRIALYKNGKYVGDGVIEDSDLK